MLSAAREVGRRLSTLSIKLSGLMFTMLGQAVVIFAHAKKVHTEYRDTDPLKMPRKLGDLCPYNHFRFFLCVFL